MPTDKPRSTITFDEELFERLENYRFENRCPNRTKAVLELLRRALNEYDKEKKLKIKQYRSFVDFGIEDDFITP